MKIMPLNTFGSSTLGLRRGFGKNGFSRSTCVFRQPVKFSHDPSLVREIESRREPSLKWIYGS